jgi:hypothetical protein
LSDAMFGANSCVAGLMAFDDDEPIGYALFYENFASFGGQRGFISKIYTLNRNIAGKESEKCF